MEKLIVKRNFFGNNSVYKEELHTGTTILFGCAWIVFLFIKGEFFNFYFIVLFILIQLFYFLQSQRITYYFTKNQFTVQFLFFKKTFLFQSFSVQKVKYDRNINEKGFKRNYIFTESLILQNNNKTYNFVESLFLEDYEKLKSFLKQNSQEKQLLKKPFILFQKNELYYTFLTLFVLSLVIALKVFLENYNKNSDSSVYYSENVLLKDGKYLQSPLSRFNILQDSGDLKIWVEKYPKIDFRYSKHKLRELKKNRKAPDLKMGDSIGLYITKDDFDYKMAKNKKYPFFTSIVTSKNEIYLIGFKYENQDYPNEIQEISSTNKHLLFLLPLLFSFIFSINLYVVKLKYV